MKTQHYHYRDKVGQEIGPFDLETLAKLRLGGVLDADTPVRAADSAEWRPCREFIADAKASPPPPPSPTAPATGKVHASRRTRVLWLVALLLITVAVGVALNVLLSHLGENNEGQREYDAKMEDLRRQVNRDIDEHKGTPRRPSADSAMSPSEARRRQWSLDELKTLMRSKANDDAKNKEDVKKLFGPPDSTLENGRIYVYTGMKIRNPDTERNDNTLLLEFKLRTVYATTK